MWLAYASLAAVCFGFRGILYQWTSQKPIERNLMLLGVYVSGAIVSIAAALALGQSWSPAVWTGLVMGAFSFVSNASMYKGFSVGKASLVAVFTALTPVVVAAVSYFRWGETLNLWQAAAFLVIVAGIVIIRYSNDLSWRNLQGVQWALLAMVTFGITDLASKQAMLWHADKLPTLFIMYATGSVLFFLLWSLGRLRKGMLGVGARREVAVANVSGAAAASARTDTDGRFPKADARPAAWSIRKTLGWGAFVGLSNISGMIFILPAFQHGITGLVSAVVATNVLLILLYARVFLKERWSFQELIGILCALAGVLGLRLLE
ncbi:DMT family transporter [Paenibacillus hemerocallicola]|uniref:DMT family transporter n=1 Tax=Paenibacillus hemerocallicola TaxID=1172614 RepID=A0A5C4TA38_9BACL|nr:DMT family transporter [Paenibacillus hemerocallicola]TNJ65269.1 DMT family transporter [Paenibacillus hemerocallicola]